MQTTRALIRGIAVEGQSQLIFVDTPGIFAPRRRLDRAMVTTAWSGAHEADLVGVLIDARKGLDEEADEILGRLAEVKRPKLLILNKVDLVAKEALLTLAKAANEKAKFEATFMISALTGDGVADLKRWLAQHVPPGPWLYPPDQMSDAPVRQLAAEITREKLFERLHQELPYHSTVETEAGRNCAAAISASSRRSTWSAKASARSCSAKAGRRSRQSAKPRARKSPRSSTPKCICSCSSRCARAGARTRNATAPWGWSFRRSRASEQTLASLSSSPIRGSG